MRVRAATLNRVDQVIIKGYPGLELDFPHVLGADIAGEVATLGADVSGFSEGDAVGVYPLVACGGCTLCAEDKPHLCERFQFFDPARPGSSRQAASLFTQRISRYDARPI